MTVAKLRGARDHKRRQVGWCEGGSPLHVRYPEAVCLAKRLHRTNPVTGQRRSLRKISAELAAAGHKMAQVPWERGSAAIQPGHDQGHDRGAKSACEGAGDQNLKRVQDS